MRKIYLLSPLFLILLGALIGLGSTAQESTEAEPAAAEPRVADGPVVRLAIDSIIHPVAAEHVLEALKHADEIDASAVVIELNTPGGLLTSTRDIFKAMLSAKTPVVVFVSPSGAQAASAGFFILTAADIAAMAPGTNTGAAHPVGGQGEDIEGHMGEKVEQDAAATIRSLAKEKGRNEELAQAAVVESRSFTADEALENKLIDLVAQDFEDLLRQLDGRLVSKQGEAPVKLATAHAKVEVREMGGFKRFLSAISHPNIAYILMSLGFIGLYMEFSHPGAILPGVVGAICLILAFYALSVLPVNYAGVALVFLALLLFIAEFQVPSYGLLTVGGVISLILGSLMLFRDADPALRVNMRLIGAMAATILLLVSTLTWRALSVRRTRVTTGKEGLVSEVGRARGALGPRGKVFIHGELWNAEAIEPVAADGAVEVVAVDGMTLKVKPHGEARA